MSRAPSGATAGPIPRFRILWAAVLSVLLLAPAIGWANRPTYMASTTGPPGTSPGPQSSACPRSVGLCAERNVTRVIDGDTLDVEGGLRIRIVLVDAPALTESGGPESRNYLTGLFLGRLALVDEDDFQIGADPYGRVLTVVYCPAGNANAAMISSRHALTYYVYCSASEFGTGAWSGCSSAPPPANCDPSCPDGRISPPPPDLDCADFPYRNFVVLPPDPHHFDGDGDGIGCET